MSTDFLQNASKQLYQHFFAAHEVVVSLPLLAHRTSHAQHSFNVTGIFEQLSLRMYIGLQPNTQGSSLGDIQRFDTITQERCLQTLEEYMPHTQYLASILQQNYPDIQIHCLLETGSHKALFHETLCLGIATALAMHNGHHTPDERELIQHEPKQYIMEKYLDVVQHAMKLLQGYIALPVYTALPALLIPCNRYAITLYKENELFVRDMEDLFPDQQCQYPKPVKTALIHTGVPYHEQHTLAKQKRQAEHHKAKNTILKKGFAGYFSEIHPLYEPLLTQKIQTEHGYSVNANDVMHEHISGNILCALQSLSLSPTKSTHMFHLLQTALAYHQQNYKQPRLPVQYFDTCLHLVPEEVPVALIPQHVSTFTGTFLFIAPVESERTLLENVLTSLQAIKSDVHLVTDDFTTSKETYGLCIEHHIATGNLSNLIPQKSCMLTHYDSSHEIGEYDLLVRSNTDDIIIDTINNKLYIAGKKLDATQMHSQNMTVEILSRLLDHMDDELPNTEFPPSSYTKQKNEMTSKVVSPLKKVIKSALGKELPLICSGQLYKFTLQLKRSDIRFGMIKRFHVK